MTITLSKHSLGKFRQLLHVDQHELVSDARIDATSDAGPNPHDFYDAALAACKAITLLMYAERAGIPLEEVNVSIDRDSKEERVGKYHLLVELTLIGDLDASQVERLEIIAAKCPIHKLMTTTVTSITTNYHSVKRPG